MVKDGWCQSPVAVEIKTAVESTNTTYLSNNNFKSYAYDTGSTNNYVNGSQATNVWGVFETKENFMDMHF